LYVTNASLFVTAYGIDCTLGSQHDVSLTTDLLATHKFGSLFWEMENDKGDQLWGSSNGSCKVGLRACPHMMI